MFHISLTVQDWRMAIIGHLETACCQSDGHVTDDVTLDQHVNIVTPKFNSEAL